MFGSSAVNTPRAADSRRISSSYALAPGSRTSEQVPNDIARTPSGSRAGRGEEPVGRALDVEGVPGRAVRADRGDGERRRLRAALHRRDVDAGRPQPVEQRLAEGVRARPASRRRRGSRAGRAPRRCCTGRRRAGARARAAAPARRLCPAARGRSGPLLRRRSRVVPLGRCLLRLGHRGTRGARRAAQARRCAKASPEPGTTRAGARPTRSWRRAPPGTGTPRR